ncbi:MAG: tripartite tricarboxylate transporter substrate binding protein [Burkholderiales bacterium]
MRSRRVSLVILSIAWFAFSASAPAQIYPNRPIKWIVPYPPGGITDLATRLITQKIADSLGQPIVVDNRPGANSILGADIAAKASPDGYTFLTVIAAHAANVTLYAGKLPFDPVKSFAPITLVGIAPLIMTANNSFQPRDVRELLAFAKANPGKVAFGSSGIGAAAHLATELLKQTAAIDMVHIPYKGTAPALQGLMAGDIQIFVDTPSAMMPHVRAGKIRALGVFAAQRLEAAKEVPTLAEAGGPALESATWVLFLAPANTPREIVNRVRADAAQALNSADIRERFAALGIERGGGSPEDAAKFLADEIAKWARVINVAGVKAEQ